MGEQIIAIFVIIIVSIIILAVLIAWGTTSETSGGKPVSGVTFARYGSLMQPCPCDSSQNLICDSNSFVCKKSQNQPCTDYAECATGLFCSGVCVTGPTGTLNDFCPCAEQYVCVSTNLPVPGGKQCKGSTAPCTEDIDCASLICASGHCIPGFQLAYPCSSSSQCASGNCSYGYCQPAGVTSFSKGSACSGSCVSFNGARCATTDDYPLTCQCINGTGHAGTCVIGNAGLGGPCSNSTLCAGFFQCYNNNPDPSVGQTACDPEGNCICKFTYENPNTITIDQCIEGMEPSNDICYNAIGFGCDSTPELLCVPGSVCNGGAIVAHYIFNSRNFNYVGTTGVDLGAYQVPVAQFPMMNPYKMFAGVNGESFYVVDTNYGLVYFDGLSWTQIIPASSSRGTLIDASLRRFQSQVAIAVFNMSGFSVVYTGSSFSNLTPYNPTSGAGPNGTQYDSTNTPIAASYIDISNTATSNFDVLIVTPQRAVYSKGPAAAVFSVAKIVGGPRNGVSLTGGIDYGVYGPARFYYDPSGDSLTNMAFVSSWSFYAPFPQLKQVVQFSGIAAGGPDESIGYAMPLDPYKQIYYNVYDFNIYTPAPVSGTGASFSTSPIIMLATAYDGLGNKLFNNVAIEYQSVVSFLPYQIGSSFISGFNQQNYLIMSKSSCIQ